jgi:hypothetical protein
MPATSNLPRTKPQPATTLPRLCKSQKPRSETPRIALQQAARAGKYKSTV